MNNRLGNVDNKYQNIAAHKRVLCVCSAGILRSPTAAIVLAVEYGYNTRAVGLVKEFALIPIDNVLLAWSDEIVCMDNEHEHELKIMLEHWKLETPVVNLNIEDKFSYMDSELVALIKSQYGLNTQVK